MAERMTGKAKERLRFAYRATKAIIYGEKADLTLVKDTLRCYLGSLLMEVREHVNELREEKWGNAVIHREAIHGGDILVWTKGVADGVLQCDQIDGGTGKWYWQLPDGEPFFGDDPVECLIEMIEHLEEIANARLDP